MLDYTPVSNPDDADKRTPIRIYTASKTIHAPRWRALRAHGLNIISSWIDRNPGSGNKTDLAERCIDEVRKADMLLFYAQRGEYQKGALIEVGAALAANKPVLTVGAEYVPSCFSRHPNWHSLASLDDAIDTIQLPKTLLRTIK